MTRPVAYYTLADRFPGAELRELRNLRAVLTDERRPPRKGEWYLSGSIPEAWQARNDMSSEYNILRIVKVEIREVEVESMT